MAGKRPIARLITIANMYSIAAKSNVTQNVAFTASVMPETSKDLLVKGIRETQAFEF